MDRLDTDVLAQLVADKLECLSQLRALGVRQLEAIAADDLTALLRVLAGKQRLLARLQELEPALAPFRDQPPEARVWRDPADRQRCARMAELCAALLAELVEQERQSESRLLVRRDQAAAQLQGLHRRGEAQAAYRPEVDLPAHPSYASEP
jgi:hypothetical protein